MKMRGQLYISKRLETYKQEKSYLQPANPHGSFFMNFLNPSLLSCSSFMWKFLCFSMSALFLKVNWQPDLLQWKWVVFCPWKGQWGVLQSSWPRNLQQRFGIYLQSIIYCFYHYDPPWKKRRIRLLTYLWNPSRWIALSFLW